MKKRIPPKPTHHTPVTPIYGGKYRKLIGYKCEHCQLILTASVNISEEKNRVGNIGKNHRRRVSSTAVRATVKVES